MAYSSDSNTYKSGSGLEGQDRFATGRSDVVNPTTVQPQGSTGGNQSTITTLPDDKIDSQRQKDNTPIKFPEDLGDDFYISFNTFKHSKDRPSDQRRTFNFERPIILPIPSNLTDGQSAGYNAENLFVAGNAVRESLSSAFNKDGIGGTVQTAFSKEGLNKAASSVADILDAINANPGAAAGKAALTGAVYFTDGLKGPLSAAAKSSLQLTLNPFPVMIFQGTSFKPAFSFDWTLYPESQSESDIIRQIVGFFRKEMLPERIDTNPSILRTPAIFEIKITPKGIARTFKRCVLTNMGVNYAPSGPSFLTNATGNLEKSPSAVSLSLTFQEIEVWLSNDYDNDLMTGFDPSLLKFN